VPPDRRAARSTGAGIPAKQDGGLRLHFKTLILARRGYMNSRRRSVCAAHWTRPVRASPRWSLELFRQAAQMGRRTTEEFAEVVGPHIRSGRALPGKRVPGNGAGISRADDGEHRQLSPRPSYTKPVA